jgi:hypothetical protein
MVSMVWDKVELAPMINVELLLILREVVTTLKTVEVVSVKEPPERLSVFTAKFEYVTPELIVILPPNIDKVVSGKSTFEVLFSVTTDEVTTDSAVTESPCSKPPASTVMDAPFKLSVPAVEMVVEAPLLIRRVPEVVLKNGKLLLKIKLLVDETNSVEVRRDSVAIVRFSLSGVSAPDKTDDDQIEPV